MDLEQLTKHQIILLTLLVSFVTSIATGIVTVSLINQAPPGVTQTINRIVERTVEKVVPADLSAAITTEKTVVVKEDDLTAQSIASAQKAIVRIVAVKDPDVLLARGIIVNKSGVVLTDRSALLQSGSDAFQAVLPSGARVPLTIRPATESQGGIAVGDLGVSTTTLAAVPLAESGKLQLGQSVIRIGGSGSDTVGVGVIAQLPSAGATKKFVEASVYSSTPGSVLLTLFGEVVGLVTGESLVLSTQADFYSVTEASALGL